MGDLFRRFAFSLPGLFLTAQLGSANILPAQSAEPSAQRSTNTELETCRALPDTEEADACELRYFDRLLEELQTASRGARGALDSAEDVKNRAITLLTPDLSIEVKERKPRSTPALDEYNCC